MNRRWLLLFGFPGIALFSLAWQHEPASVAWGALLVPSLVIILLVLLNGLFVAAEFSLIGVRPSRMQQLTEEGSRSARRVLTVRSSPDLQDRYIATAQLGITIASLGLGMYGEPQVAAIIEPALIDWFGIVPEAVVHTAASVVIVSILTYLHVVIGEMVPKSLALSSAERVVLAIIAPMAFLERWIFRWPVRVLNKIGAMILQVAQIPPAEGEARLYSPEELELIVAESAEEGLLNEEEEEMIRNIFDFSDRTVGQVMTPRTRVEAIPIDIAHRELLAHVAQSNHSRFPVYEDDQDHIVGILHLKDLVRQEMRTPGRTDLRLLLRPAPAVPEDQPLRQLLAAFKRLRIHMAIVLDEFGGMAGIVTLEDLVEEIVGEVRDEFDLEKEPLVEIEAGLIEVAGSYLVDDLEDDILLLEQDEELPDVDTIGGLIVTWLGRPAKVGDTVNYKDVVRFEVLGIDGLAVTRARVDFRAVLAAPEEASPGSDLTHPPGQ